MKKLKKAVAVLAIGLGLFAYANQLLRQLVTKVWTGLSIMVIKDSLVMPMTSFQSHRLVAIMALASTGNQPMPHRYSHQSHRVNVPTPIFGIRV